MNDVIFIVIALAFFALAALYVKFCDVIVGPDTTAVDVTDDVPATEEVGA